MGKKKIKKQTEEELLKESESVKEPGEKAAVPVKVARQVLKGKIYIQASYNNTVITVADDKGNVLAWSSAGTLGFKGPKKATPYAASKIVETLMEKIKKIAFSGVEIFVSGIGAGRESAIRSFINHGLNVILIKDITPIPHNGPRPKKVRRV